ncbi:hypothetical protein BLNAU_12140 [Blattamonas nauphoetae]|uniref:Uncharacterized protein n=1 Tax=Blattamonas nauphoetae TaxID=2049346 RepID=A0ABQ9XN68_9EUKA|nr:hypothetical protein BLNAU_12140 [Blattamonas nauphoetae]
MVDIIDNNYRLIIPITPHQLKEASHNKMRAALTDLVRTGDIVLIDYQISQFPTVYFGTSVTGRDDVLLRTLRFIDTEIQTHQDPSVDLDKFRTYLEWHKNSVVVVNSSALIEEANSVPMRLCQYFFGGPERFFQEQDLRHHSQFKKWMEMIYKQRTLQNDKNSKSANSRRFLNSRSLLMDDCFSDALRSLQSKFQTLLDLSTQSDFHSKPSQSISTVSDDKEGSSSQELSFSIEPPPFLTTSVWQSSIGTESLFYDQTASEKYTPNSLLTHLPQSSLDESELPQSSLDVSELHDMLTQIHTLLSGVTAYPHVHRNRSEETLLQRSYITEVIVNYHVDLIDCSRLVDPSNPGIFSSEMFLCENENDLLGAILKVYVVMNVRDNRPDRSSCNFIADLPSFIDGLLSVMHSHNRDIRSLSTAICITLTNYVNVRPFHKHIITKLKTSFQDGYIEEQTCFMFVLNQALLNVKPTPLLIDSDEIVREGLLLLKQVDWDGLINADLNDVMSVSYALALVVRLIQHRSKLFFSENTVLSIASNFEKTQRFMPLLELEFSSQESPFLEDLAAVRHGISYALLMSLYFGNPFPPVITAYVVKQNDPLVNLIHPSIPTGILLNLTSRSYLSAPYIPLDVFFEREVRRAHDFVVSVGRDIMFSNKSVLKTPLYGLHSLLIRGFHIPFTQLGLNAITLGWVSICGDIDKSLIQSFSPLYAHYPPPLLISFISNDFDIIFQDHHFLSSFALGTVVLHWLSFPITFDSPFIPHLPNIYRQSFQHSVKRGQDPDGSIIVRLSPLYVTFLEHDLTQTFKMIRKYPLYFPPALVSVLLLFLDKFVSLCSEIQVLILIKSDMLDHVILAVEDSPFLEDYNHGISIIGTFLRTIFQDRLEMCMMNCRFVGLESITPMLFNGIRYFVG